MSKQFVIQSRTARQDGNRVPLGNRDEIVESLSRFNTLAEVEGGDMLWGPGIRIELPPDDEVQQMLLHIVEEEIAWLPIVRLAKQFDWSVTDIETGRELQP